MNPSEDKTYLYMKKLVTKNYKLDLFDRFSDNKFIENNEELKKIGEEIINNFSKHQNLKIHFFADICAAPGCYSQIILDNFDIINGIGISLPYEEGGVKFEIEDKKFKKIYKNILDNKYRLDLPIKLDLGIGSCMSYQYNAKISNKLNLQLIIKSIYLLLPNFKKSSSLIINMSMKNIFIAFNLINIISKYFKNIKLWKSSNIWATKNTFYLFGYDFIENKNITNELNNLFILIDNEKNDIYNKFIGTNEEYNKINKMINNIYYIRINAWKKLIESQNITAN